MEQVGSEGDEAETFGCEPKYSKIYFGFCSIRGVDFMKKINIIKENEIYNRMIQTIKPYKYKDYIIYIERNDKKIYQFGFSVGKKVGNAVTRNKIKRQLKSIIDKKNYQNNFSCIIMVRKSILEKKYSEMENDLLSIFSKINILKENPNE